MIRSHAAGYILRKACHRRHTLLHNNPRRAATAVEYGLIAGGILLAIILGVTHTGTSLANLFGGMSNSVSSAGVTYPGSAIPGVTGVDGIPSWVTTACQLPTITQLQAAAAQPSTGSGTTFGCIPANSKVTTYTTTSSGAATGYYVTTPGSPTRSLFAIYYPRFSQVFGYTQYYNGAYSSASSCTGSSYSSASPAEYSYGSYNSGTNVCTTNGLTPAGSPFGTPGQPSMASMLLQNTYYQFLGNAITLPNP